MSTAILRRASVALLTVGGVLIALDLFSQDKAPPPDGKQALPPAANCLISATICW